MAKTQNLNSGQSDSKVFFYAWGLVYSCKKYAPFGTQEWVERDHSLATSS